MLELGRVSRSSFYRFDPDGKPGADGDLALRDAMQRIALEWPSYGRPRRPEPNSMMLLGSGVVMPPVEPSNVKASEGIEPMVFS